MKAIKLLLSFILLSITTISTSSTTTTSFDAATSFVIFTCRSTTYPKLCENTCLPFSPKISVDLIRMAHYATNSALGFAKSVSWSVYKVSKEKKLESSTKTAIQDCVKLAMDSVAKIKKSLEEVDSMKNGKKNKLMNVKSWMSAAMTNYQTCMEGLDEVNASAVVKREISRRIRHATMLSSNALAIVNKVK